MAARLVTALRERGHEPLVVTTRSDDALPAEDTYAGVAVRRLDFGSALRSGSLDQFGSVRSAVSALKRDFRPDVVHLTLLGPDTLFHLDTARAHAAPTIVTVQQSAISRLGHRKDSVLGRALREADRAVYCSRAMRDEMESVLPELTGRSSVIPNALDPPPAGAIEPMPHGRILCLGRMVWDKGFDVALAAFARLAARRPDARLILAGDGPARADLESLAGSLAVTDRVEFPGWVAPDQVPALLNRAGLVLVPSRREAFGLVALEAMVMGRPVIASDVGGLPEVVVHGRTGILIPPGQVDLFADALDRLLRDPRRAVALGTEGRRVAQERFGWAKHVDAYEELYRQLTNKEKGSHEFGSATAIRAERQ